MSKLRLIPLPAKGLDTRSSFGTPQDSLSSVTGMRVIDNTLRRSGDLSSTNIGGPTGTEITRNLVHMFFAPPGHEENLLVALTTNRMATYTLTGWSTREAGYNLNTSVIASGHFRPRFAWANSAHKFVWTLSEAVPSIRVRVFDGSTVTTIAQDYSAKYLIAYNKRIVIANTYEAGVSNTARIRWCTNGNFLDWTGLGSGFLEIGSNTSSGGITGLYNFDEIAVISVVGEFIELLSTGSLFPVFELGRHSEGVAVAAPRSWQVWNHVAFFLGPDNVYAWDRSSFKAIGDPIVKLLKPYLDPYRMITIQGLVLPARGEYYLLMSSGGDEGANNSLVFIYDLKSDRWFTDTYVGISAIGKINQTLAPSFFSPRQHESPEFIVAGDTVDHVYLEKSYQDTETVTTANVGFTTQDFFALNSQDVPDMNAKNEFLALTFRTHPLTTLNVSLSIDKGMSYIGPMVVTANAQGLALYNFMVSFSHIRFTFSQRTTQFPLMVEGPLSMEWERSGDTY